jgi:hypothetical protein
VTKFEQQVAEALKYIVLPGDEHDDPDVHTSVLQGDQAELLAPRVAAAIDKAWRTERQFELGNLIDDQSEDRNDRIRNAALAALRGTP